MSPRNNNHSLMGSLQECNNCLRLQRCNGYVLPNKTQPSQRWKRRRRTLADPAGRARSSPPGEGEVEPAASTSTYFWAGPGSTRS